MVLAVEIIGIITMGALILLSIWGFIILNKILSQLKYKNYILEKLSDNIKDIAVKNYNEKK